MISVGGIIGIYSILFGFDPGVLIQWNTASEVETVGFNLYRSDVEEGPFEQINQAIIPASSDPFTGSSYSYRDYDTEAGNTYYYKLEDVSINGKTKFHPPVSATAPSPEKHELFPNYPNPFNKSTVFKYQIPVKTHVIIEIFNVLGRKIRTIIDENKEIGFYTVSWDGLDSHGLPVVSGIYFYHMSTNSFRTTRKMTVIR